MKIDQYRGDARAVVRDAGSRDAAQLESRLAALRAAKSRTISAVPLWDKLMSWPTKESVQELAAVYRDALARAPDYRPAQLRAAICYATLGEIHLAEGDTETARAWFREALEADPGNTAANLQIGVGRTGRARPRARPFRGRDLALAALRRCPGRGRSGADATGSLR